MNSNSANTTDSHQNKRPDRRLSGTSSTSLVGWSKSDSSKRPLNAVLSEECVNSPGTGRNSSANQTVLGGAGNADRQSLLRKLNWSESKSSLSSGIGGPKETVSQRSTLDNTTCPPKVVGPATECDKKPNHEDDDLESSSKAVDRRQGDDKEAPNKRPNEQYIAQTLERNQDEPGERNQDKKPVLNEELDDQQRIGSAAELSNEIQRQKEEAEYDEEEEEDDNQVVPSWPSRSDTLAAKQSTKYVQHTVYSLKDYSQVANPNSQVSSFTTAPAARMSIASGSSSSSNAGRLLKTFSQDRKVNTESKRMSECLYLSGAQAAAAAATTAGASKQPNPSISGRTSTGSFSISPGDGSLLNPVNGRQHQAALLGDRMRKLFVPLGLRGGNAAAKISSSPADAGQPRLSFQSGASMLNKPHHLMHVMYRTTGTSTEGDALINRRSPLHGAGGSGKTGKGFRVYGCPLHMANNIFPITCFGKPDVYRQSHVPYVLARLCSYIEDNSSQLTHEGIFRVSGNARLMEKLRTLFDRLGDAPLELESVDVATSASMLKMYLRELPEPLIPTRLNYYFITLAKKYASYLSKDNFPAYKTASKASGASTASAPPPPDQPAQATAESRASSERQRLAFARDLTKLLRKLPIENYNLLKYLACFLYRVSLKQQYNKMCAEALGIVFGPNVFRIRSESYKGLKEQELSNQIMASIISNYKCIFDSEITDPLGNLIDCGSVEVSLPSSVDGTKAKQQQPPTQEHNTGQPHHHHHHSHLQPSIPSSVVAVSSPLVDPKLETSPLIRDLPNAAELNSQPSTSTADTSASAAAVASVVADTSSKDHDCCPKHCRGCPFEEEDEVVSQIADNSSAAMKSFQSNHRHDSDENDDDEDDDENVDDEDDDDEEEEDDEEDDLDDDDEDENDCDEEESYTPSTGTGSFCSSMDSETLESTYDGLEQPNDAELSSSECASDTSYTPTSSHTDSELGADEAAGSFYGETSSFESSPSAGRMLAGSPGPKDACLECKRRESVQKGGAANAIDELEEFNIGVDLPGEEGADSIGVGVAVELVCEEKQLAAEQQKPSVEVSASPEPQAEIQVQVEEKQAVASSAFTKSDLELQQQQQQQARSSLKATKSRRRRKDGSSAKTQTTSELASSEISGDDGYLGQLIHRGALEVAGSGSPQDEGLKRSFGVASNGGGGDDDEEDGNNHASIASAALMAKSRHSAANGSSRQAHRSAQFLRRRSSSASSLSRIKHKRDQMAAIQRQALKDGSSHHRPSTSSAAQSSATTTTTATTSSKLANQMQLDKRRLHAEAARERSSSRRSRHGNRHVNRRLPVTTTTTTVTDANLSAANLQESAGFRNRSSLKSRDANVDFSRGSSHRGRHHSQPSTAVVNPDLTAALKLAEEVSAMNLQQTPAIAATVSVANNDQQPYFADCTDLLSAQYLEELESDKYFLLRSFNSDETLLRSLNYCNEYVQSTSTALGNKPTRRRFSGYDYEPKVTGLVSVTNIQASSKQIYEVLDDNQISQMTSGEFVKQAEATPAEPSLLSSFVSLLDNRLTGFRKSELSIDDESHSEDPILIQMKAFKELIRVLKRCLKMGSTAHGFNADIEATLLKLAECPNRSRYSHSCAACRTDHLCARSLAQKLEMDLEATTYRAATSSAEDLIEILTVKISLLKKRYQDLKNIRDHFTRNHANSSDSSKNKPVNATPSSAPAPADISCENPQKSTEPEPSDPPTVSDMPTSSSEQVIAESDTFDRCAELASKTRISDSSSPQSGRHVRNCSFGSLCPVEFVVNIEKRLASKRIQGSRELKIYEMNDDQLQAEKLELQKNLLRYEHWFGRPVTSLEFSLVGHLYERYRAVKVIKAARQETASV